LTPFRSLWQLKLSHLRPIQARPRALCPRVPASRPGDQPGGARPAGAQVATPAAENLCAAARWVTAS